MRVGYEMSNWELSKKPASMQANTWEIFIIRLRQSCVLLHEICIVVLQVVLWNLKLVEILSKSTKAVKITLLYRINCSVLKGFPVLEKKFHIYLYPCIILYSKLSICCEYTVAIVFFCCCCFCNVIYNVLEWDPERHLDLENKPTGNSKAILHSQCR